MAQSAYREAVEAFEAAQRVFALATTDGDGVLQALANQYLGIAYHVQSDYHRATDFLGQAVASLEGARRTADLQEATALLEAVV
jgi:hypothetical protein